MSLWMSSGGLALDLSLHLRGLKLFTSCEVAKDASQMLYGQLDERLRLHALLEGFQHCSDLHFRV